MVIQICNNVSTEFPFLREEGSLLIGPRMLHCLSGSWGGSFTIVRSTSIPWVPLVGGCLGRASHLKVSLKPAEVGRSHLLQGKISRMTYFQREISGDFLSVPSSWRNHTLCSLSVKIISLLHEALPRAWIQNNQGSRSTRSVTQLPLHGSRRGQVSWKAPAARQSAGEFLS